MTVSTKHPLYQQMFDHWLRIRDAKAGEKAIKDRTTKYLPRPGGMNTTAYDGYLERATWYGATSRTIEALHGMMFYKDVGVEVPGDLESLMEDVTLADQSFQQFARTAGDEAITVGRGGILVDFPDVELDNRPLSIAEAEEQGRRPYMHLYQAEDVINWRTRRVEGETILTLVVLRETFESEDDPFSHDTDYQYRVLRLEPENGTYQQVVVRSNDAEDGDLSDDEQIDQETGLPIGSGNRVVEVAEPKIDGNTLNRIPFTFVGITDTTPEPNTPPLLPLVNVNISHYQNSADYEHGLHFTGLPIITVSGLSKEEKEDTWAVGSPEAWTFGDPNAEAQYLEFEGKGLSEVSGAMESKKEWMAFLGARMLTPEKRQAEAAETLKLRQRGETSALAKIAISLGDALRTSLEWMLKWQNGGSLPSDEIVVGVNREFTPSSLSADDLFKLFKIWQGGGMDFEAFIRNMKRGGAIEDDRDPQTIQEQIAAEDIPSMGSLGGGFGGQGDEDEGGGGGDDGDGAQE